MTNLESPVKKFDMSGPVLQGAYNHSVTVKDDIAYNLPLTKVYHWYDKKNTTVLQKNRLVMMVMCNTKVEI